MTDMKKDNLLTDLFHAYYDARKNKRNTINQLRFEMNLEQNIYELYKSIEERRYKPKQSLAFIVFKPVQREVFAADFSDRVVHHLLFNYVNPIFERTYIQDCYSCRKGKGTLYAIKRLEGHIRSCSNNHTRPCFVLKLDLQGYFMSINKQILHQAVKNTLEKFSARCDTDGVRWKDKLDYDLIMYLSETIIFHDPTENFFIKGSRSDWDGLPVSKSLFHAKEGCGLPIGNLTSQLFSNIYMSSFDYYVKRELKFRHYGRYVDDFYLVDTDKNKLRAIIPELKEFLQANLGLNIHPRKIYLQHYRNGVLFTGGFIKAHRTYASNRVKDSLNKKLKELNTQKALNPKDLQASVNSYLGIMKHFKSFNLRREIMMKQAWVFNYGYVQKCCSVFKLNKNKRHNCYA